MKRNDMINDTLLEKVFAGSELVPHFPYPERETTLNLKKSELFTNNGWKDDIPGWRGMWLVFNPSQCITKNDDIPSPSLRLPT